MKVWVLVGRIQYEGEWNVGVYASEALANCAIETNRDQRKAEDRFKFEEYFVEEFEVKQ